MTEVLFVVSTISFDGPQGMDQDRSPGRVDTAHPGQTPTFCEVTACGSAPSGFFEAKFVSRSEESSTRRSLRCRRWSPRIRAQSVPPQQVAEAAARVGRFGAALALLGEDDPDAEPLKVALKQAKLHARVRAVGERLDLCLQYVTSVKRQVARAEEQVWEANDVQAQMEEKLASGLRDLEALRAEASEHPRQCPEPSIPREAMDIDPSEELIRLRAQVQSCSPRVKAIQEIEPSRSKKARTSVSTE